MCQCYVPNSWVAMKQWHPNRTQPSYLLSPWSEWQRKILLGVNGHIPVGKKEREVSVYLQERHPSDSQPLAHRAPFGAPVLSLVSGWIPWAEMHEMAERMEALTLGSGWTVPSTGHWNVNLKQAGETDVTWTTHRHSLLFKLQRKLDAVAAIDSPTLVAWVQEAGMKTQTTPSPQVFLEKDKALPPIPTQPYQTKAEEATFPTKGWHLLTEMTLLGLPKQVRWGILRLGHGALFQECRKANPKVPPVRWGELLYSWPIHLKRKGVPIHQLTAQRYLAIASLHGLGRCHREVLMDLLAFAALFPSTSIRHLLKQKMGVNPVTPSELETKIGSWLRGPLPRSTDWKTREKVWMGRLMERVRGALSGREVRRALYRYFSEHPPTEWDQCDYPPSEPRRNT
ncbi:MAG: hypothetical protein EP343_10710 [Deltaproteobacteria bacterium]|nr:MAG: hypothetical protein EP343_10710 [Deltaproteobacteria bacterium]